MTKQELIQGLLDQGLEAEAIEVIKKAVSSMPEELSQENIRVVADLVDEMEKTDSLLLYSIDQQVDALDSASDDIMSALDGYVEEAAAETIKDIKFVESLIE